MRPKDWRELALALLIGCALGCAYPAQWIV